MHTLVIFLLILQFIPFGVTAIIVDGSGKHKREGSKGVILANALGNLLVYVFSTLLIYSQNPIEVIHNFLINDFSYQDITRECMTISVCMMAAGLGGIILRRFIYTEETTLYAVMITKVLLLGFAVLCPCLCALETVEKASHNIKIIEVCRKEWLESDIGEEIDTTDDIVIDENSYVTIVNTGDYSYEISNFQLSDDAENEGGVTLTDIVLQPDEEYQYSLAEAKEINIKKKGGKILYLFTESNTLVDQVSVPALDVNQAYALMNDDTWAVIELDGTTDPDQKAENDEAVVAKPQPSRTSGFYEEGFDLELTSEPNTTIYYTTDGSIPTDNSIKYTLPINIYDCSDQENKYRNLLNLRDDYTETVSDEIVDKAFILRAIAIDEDGNKSDVITETYFVGLQGYEDTNVVSLIADPDDLFGDDGICVTGKEYDEWTNYYGVWYQEKKNELENGLIDAIEDPVPNFTKQGKEWERTADFTLFESQEIKLSQLVGIRVQGHGSRYSALKRFSLYAREEYSGSYYFATNIINNNQQHSMVLRQGDHHALSESLLCNRDMATQEFIPVVFFLNGEFWFEGYLYEKFDESNIAEKYGLSKDNIAIVKNGETDELSEEGDNPFSRISDFLNTHDMAVDDNYQQFNQILDVQSYIDEICANIYLQNSDYREQWNNMYWHTIIKENDEEGDTRWRMGLIDMDLAWTTIDSVADKEQEIYQINPFEVCGTNQVTCVTEWPMFSKLVKNEEFCKQFVLTFMDEVNSDFSNTHVLTKLEQLNITFDENPDLWNFFKYREQYIVPYVAEEFGLSGQTGEVVITADTDQYEISLNTIKPSLVSGTEAYANNSKYYWKGYYFTEYPVTISVNTPAFDHWEITVNGETSTYKEQSIEVPVVSTGVEIHAVFH